MFNDIFLTKVNSIFLIFHEKFNLYSIKNKKQKKKKKISFSNFHIDDLLNLLDKLKQI
jgi:hypothetical protein